ncbi:Por secretion system C-terminal sorting domain-containing protein [Flexibacter flexilis DSM 6793]|uniref:Por secretion system C-terminal sorting domain-containing protein n=1 Tax=Flexibacter flexilis DSM 6793 TaxID=927664 RepID=A0A1I1IU04_9BACT|nr:T9SS type A sorting domain-containing protein [Flexibacter flexilis]SFC37203.1 Por secretion system C-terminal sorting domain-containing protein [Flexibacter flexilis DSM 6793]
MRTYLRCSGSCMFRLLVCLNILLGIPFIALGQESFFRWGENSIQSDIPSNLTVANTASLHAGYFHSAAIKKDSTLFVWGSSGTHITGPNGMKVIDVTLGRPFTTIIKPDSTVAAWGDNLYGQCNVPQNLTKVIKIDAGWYHTLALRADSTVVAWGDNFFGQCNVPAGLHSVIAVSAGAKASYAVKADGSVVAWGNGDNGQLNIPASAVGVTDISAGDFSVIALKSDGTVVHWGTMITNVSMPSNLNDIVAISAGSFHYTVQRANGNIVSWGQSTFLEAPAPSGLVAIQFSAGYHYNLAIGHIDNLTSLKSISEFNVSVYPVPSTGMVNVEIADLEESAAYEVYNVYGQKVAAGTLANSSNVLDLSKQATGVYTLKVVTAKGSATKQIVLNK